MQNKYDHDGKCLSLGMNTQNKFDNIMKKRGYKYREATKSEDMNGHYDRILLLNFNPKEPTELKIEIKAKKRKNGGRKSNSEPQSEWILLETKGVRKGENGWLYNGKAHWIMFELDNCFIGFRRKSLIEFLDENKNKIKDRIPSSTGCVTYQRYYRHGRTDEFVWIPLKDLQKELEQLIIPL